MTLDFYLQYAKAIQDPIKRKLENNDNSSNKAIKTNTQTSGISLEEKYTIFYLYSFVY